MRKLDHDEERQKIAAVAANLIASKGAKNVTVNDVALAMDATRGKVLHYFSSSQDVIDAAFEWANTKAVKRMKELSEGIESPEFNEDIVASLLPLDESTDIEWKVRFACWEASLSTPEGVVFQKAIATSRIEEVRLILEKMQQTGIVRKDLDATIVSQQLYDLMTGLGITLLYYPLEQRAIRSQSMFVFLRSLLAN